MKTTDQAPPVFDVKPSDIVIKHFEGRPVPFRLEDGKLSLTAEEAGRLFEYRQPGKAIDHLYRGHRDEFDNDCTQVAILAVRDGSPPRRERIFFLEGLILLSMLSEQPRAKAARHWLRKIGKQVAVEGYYVAPGLQQGLVAAILPAILEQALPQITDHIKSMMIPATPDVSKWACPAQRARQICSPIPKCFNGGGSFDWFYHDFYLREEGHPPMMRHRHGLGKRAEVVVMPCVPEDDRIRRAFRSYMKQMPRQRRLFG